MILLGLLAVGIFFWAARSGQFDDLEGEASRILMDEDLPSDSAASSVAPHQAAVPDGERR